MKARYEMPEINMLKLRVEDVIVTSAQAGTLSKEDVYDTGSGNPLEDWGALWP